MVKQSSNLDAEVVSVQNDGSSNAKPVVGTKSQDAQSRRKFDVNRHLGAVKVRRDDLASELANSVARGDAHISRPTPGTDSAAGEKEEEKTPDIWIRLEDLEPNPYGVRDEYDQDLVLERARSILEHGQLDSIKVCPSFIDPRKFIIIDGRYRVLALTHLQQDVVRAKVKTVQSKGDLLRLSRYYNNAGYPHGDTAEATAVVKLWHDRVYKTQTALAQALDLSAGYVSKALAVDDLPAEVLKRIKLSRNQSSLGLTVVYQLALLYRSGTTQKAILDLIDKLEAGKISRTKIENMRAGNAGDGQETGSTHGSDDAAKKRKDYALGRAYEIASPSGKAGFVKAWEDGRIKLQVTLPAGRSADDLAVQIRDFLQSYVAGKEPQGAGTAGGVEASDTAAGLNAGGAPQATADEQKPANGAH